jgi:hypothetical protein
MYAETFKTIPKGTIEIQVVSVRSIGKNLATSEGIIRFIPTDGKEPEVTKYTALLACEGDGWLTASAREWVADPAELLKLSDLDWLIGEWEAKKDDRVTGRVSRSEIEHGIEEAGNGEDVRRRGPPDSQRPGLAIDPAGRRTGRATPRPGRNGSPIHSEVRLAENQSVVGSVSFLQSTQTRLPLRQIGESIRNSSFIVMKLNTTKSQSTELIE